ncbi:MAG TPA: cytochrome-c oxidase, cbb3-type subunit III [Gammaproteobacteria bacterium]|nr:cytochrome-c oxidase, cbb3-type subunit III [Gammaproteobacteria bacterium]
MNSFLHWFVIVVSIGSFLGCIWLIWWASKKTEGESTEGEVTGHVWDGDLAELNNPMPRWWLYMFYFSIAFGLIYMVLYPSLGNYKGLLGWSSDGQYQEEIAAANKSYGPLYAGYAKMPVSQLVSNNKAVATGRRLFLNYCAQCHGSDAGGAPGFPSLKDSSWLYGGTPEAIKASILDGRNGSMPPMAAALGTDADVDNVANYVMSLSGAPHDAGKASLGKAKFAVCGGCHGMDGSGNQAIGAPDLTDANWLYGGSLGAIKKAIQNGRSGKMPAHRDFLGEDKVHLLAAYVYSLSQ